MNFNDKIFIITTNNDIKDALLLNSFALVSADRGLYIFINEPEKIQNLKPEIRDNLVFADSMDF